jgi:ectoine hydroxylase-related dioxygenase (phytanoyl-CoA dioxygenase family)
MTKGNGMRNLTSEEKAAFDADGVVLLKRAVAPEWVPLITEAVDRELDVDVDGLPREVRAGGMARHLFVDNPDFATFLHETGLARLAAQATGSSTIRAYFDQIFIKPADAGDKVFDWHQDAPYWPIGGDTVVSTWLALTSNSAESSALEFVRGSHLWDVSYRPVAGDGSREAMNQMWDGFGDLAHSMPDEVLAFEDHPDRYDILQFEVEPGDALLFDYRIVHRSRGNPTPNRRVAVSWRWLGDRARWAWERGKDPVVNQSHTTVQPGDLIADDTAFPVVYRVPATV